jgi:molybdenum cofactor cytidylyltransferase
VLLVLREDVALTLGPLPTGVRAVLSHAPDAWGPAGSLQAATWSLSMEGLVCVTPVDALPVGSRVYRALREAVGAQDVLAAVPTFEGRGGHPVLMHAQVLRPYRACSVPRSLREMLSSLGDRVQRVPVPDPRVRADLDTPEAVDLWRHRRSFVYNHD